MPGYYNFIIFSKTNSQPFVWSYWSHSNTHTITLSIIQSSSSICPSVCLKLKILVINKPNGLYSSGNIWSCGGFSLFLRRLGYHPSPNGRNLGSKFDYLSISDAADSTILDVQRISSQGRSSMGYSMPEFILSCTAHAMTGKLHWKALKQYILLYLKFLFISKFKKNKRGG